MKREIGDEFLRRILALLFAISLWGYIYYFRIEGEMYTKEDMSIVFSKELVEKYAVLEDVHLTTSIVLSGNKRVLRQFIGDDSQIYIDTPESIVNRGDYLVISINEEHIELPAGISLDRIVKPKFRINLPKTCEDMLFPKDNGMEAM